MIWLLAIVYFAFRVTAQDRPSIPQGCSDGGCYPATGNLLIGRADKLGASSTCGLGTEEEYCIVSHLQQEDKCFTCDSRKPYDVITKRSHRIENVIYMMDEEMDLTWWQSSNGMEEVNIQLDLEAEFHFTHLIMKFKTFRPAAMIIERSADFGRSWKPYRYFSYNCTKMFPTIPFRPLHHINDVICEERYSDIEPSTEGEVIYKVLDPSIKVKDPYSLEIQELLQITNLRIKFTKLHTLGDNLLDRRVEVLKKYYYAIYELVVRGSCFCYGHASECTPISGMTGGVEGMIHGRCVCKHNTEGLNCERCKPFFNDLPWSPAEAHNPHTCKECNCNGHSSHCHFDMAVYLATGNVSGGVCDNCLHNTMGRNCEICKPFYYQDPSRDIRNPAACIACDCDPVGSLDGGICDSHTDLTLGILAGQCRCKENVKGIRCDYCKEGFYGLSRNDPVGCQPCNCDPRGITIGEAPCDQISGDCSCKRYVTGRYCNQCLPEYWGLSHDITGCRSCDCDFGGAYNNRCMMDNGQCPCRPHITSRQCDEVQLGYFCASLDFYTYEAEHALPYSPEDLQIPGKPRPPADINCLDYMETIRQRIRRQHRRHQQKRHRRHRKVRQLQQKPDVEIVHREQGHGRVVTWTGPGFARVKDGAGLVFTIDNIPYSMDYDIIIRYETESTEDWEAIISITSHSLPMSLRCGNILSSEQMYIVKLLHDQRYIKMPRPFCFESNNRYMVAIRFQRFGVAERYFNAFILIDSLVLFPKYTELPGFHGNDPLAVHHREEMERYMCVESFMMVPMPELAEMCIKLLCSISAILHDGAVSCNCDPQGSYSAVCEKIGGQCQCKLNVIGHRCDQCAPGTYGFGPYGCSSCNCNSQGSESFFCDPVMGQCPCKSQVTGRQCGSCHPGHWGFPHCRQCHCNGHSEECDPQTGACITCRDHTTGHYCDRCVDGFYGNPILEYGEHCRPCPCPGNPGSDHFNGISCSLDGTSSQIICNCFPGYSGPRCDRCAPGYFGNPEDQGGECHPCQCSGNIDTSDRGACDAHTGECLMCLYNTHGPSCSECKPGFYGNALAHDCRCCTCNSAGTLRAQCTGDMCRCDGTTGMCQCRPNVVGQNCDLCAPNHWNFGMPGGCEPCGCHPLNSFRSDCNIFTGQCHCLPGFGGRTCFDCEANYWGDPNIKCRACDCDPLGSSTPQCDRHTGKCFCVEGATGQKCNQCDRGFTGHFPKCIRCHHCFQQWESIVNRLYEEIRRIEQRIKHIENTGIPSDTLDRRIQELQEKLVQIQNLLKDRSTEMIFQIVSESTNNLRIEISEIDGQLLQVSESLNSTRHRDEQLQNRLHKMETETRDLNNTVKILHDKLQNLLTSGASEQFENIKMYYDESLEAERRANESVFGDRSPVAESQETRIKTEDLLNRKKNEFHRTMTAHTKTLKELQNKTKDLDSNLNHLNEKVCGSMNKKKNGKHNCTTDPCGGAGCRDEFNKRKCGGETCNGTVSSAFKALKVVQNKSSEIEAIADRLSDVEKELRNIKMIAEEAKSQTQNTLKKAQTTKDEIDESNQKLKEFLKKIKDFLNEEGADPKNIELVSRLVLNISLPVTSGNLSEIIRQIRESISSLGNVDQILNSTAKHLKQAQDLLNEANDAKSRAEDIKEVVNDTKLALETAQMSIDEANRTLKKAQKNIKGINKTTEMIQSKFQNISTKQMDAMKRLSDLAKNVDLLQNNTDLNRLKASKANISAENAMMEVNSLNEDFQEINRKFKELNKTIGGTEGMGDLSSRVNKVKEEAEELLRAANKKIKNVEDLERKFKMNEEKMQQQAKILKELETTIINIREMIHNNMTHYSSCTS
uniref:Laminin subunit beta-1 n=1 Tax=Erpetoichthys calabaricus TaxID=27687 RepID=A0A8C4XFR5_ERPCA